MVQTVGGVMVTVIFSWHTLGILVQTDHQLNTTVYPSIVADHPFMTSVPILLFTSSFQQDNTLSHKAQLILNWFL